MRRPLLIALSLSIVVPMALAYAGIVGVFQGRIVHPTGMKREEGILYVRARNGMARKVKVEKAVVVEYDEDVPKPQRRKSPAESLCDNTLVRVTAEQSEREDGEWKAINILILAEPEPEAGRSQMKKTAYLQSPTGPKAEPSTKAPAGGTNGFCTP
jgi:hypothetical protein